MVCGLFPHVMIFRQPRFGACFNIVQQSFPPIMHNTIQINGSQYQRNPFQLIHFSKRNNFNQDVGQIRLVCGLFPHVMIFLQPHLGACFNIIQQVVSTNNAQYYTNQWFPVSEKSIPDNTLK